MRFEEIYETTDEPLYRGHFTPLGNKVTALVVYEFLSNKGYNRD